jgi:hypothetical protein
MAVLADPIAGTIARLSADATVAGLVGSRIGTRADAAGSDAADLPYIALQEITGRDERHMGGDTTIASATVQVDCVAADSVAAHDLRQAALARWRSFVRGDIAVGSDVFRVDSIAIEGIDGRQARPTEGHSAPRFIKSFDLSFMYRTS